MNADVLNAINYIKANFPITFALETIANNYNTIDALNSFVDKRFLK